jgi:hypothetical protein
MRREEGGWRVIGVGFVDDETRGGCVGFSWFSFHGVASETAAANQTKPTRQQSILMLTCRRNQARLQEQQTCI